MKKLKDLWFERIRTPLRNFKYWCLQPYIFLWNVWHFRKEMWRFRQWDHMFNLEVFLRSLELTAQHLDSEDCVTSCGHDDAAEIRKFINLVKCSQNPDEEAARLTGIDVDIGLRVLQASGWNFMYANEPEKNWTQDQKDYEILRKKANEIEERYWKNAWKLYARRGQCWWE